MKSFPKQIVLLTLLIAVPSFASIHIVTDIDDTIRVTSVHDPVAAVWNTVIRMRPFAGMPELLQSLLAQDSDRKIDYVTGAPGVLRFEVERFLSKNEFPEGGVHFAPLILAQDSLANYKLAQIRKIMAGDPDSKFIFLGDDQQFDPTVYFTLFLENPSQVKEIYIHKIRDVRLPSAVYPFITAFDIARMEYEFLRMDLSSVLKVGQAIVDEKSDKKILPYFQTCPSALTLQTDNHEVIEMQEKVDDRVKEICEKRDLL